MVKCKQSSHSVCNEIAVFVFFLVQFIVLLPVWKLEGEQKKEDSHILWWCSWCLYICLCVGTVVDALTKDNQCYRIKNIIYTLCRKFTKRIGQLLKNVTHICSKKFKLTSNLYSYSIAKILWDHIHTDQQVMANRLYMVVDKWKKKAVVVDVAIPSDSNIRKKKHKKLEIYQGLKEQLDDMWKLKVKVIPIVTGFLRVVTPKLEERLQQIPGTSDMSVQKTVALGTAKIKWKFFKLPGVW